MSDSKLPNETVPVIASQDADSGHRWTPRRAKVATVLAAGYLLLMLNARYPTLRLSTGRANDFVFLCGQLVPWLLLVLVASAGPWWCRLTLSVILLPLLGLSVIVSLLMLFFTPFTDPDPSFERIRSVDVEQRTLVLYRTNGGATTAFGIVVRQECPVLPGLLLVDRLYGVDHASDVQITHVGPRRVRVVGGLVEIANQYQVDARELQLPAWSCADVTLWEQ